MLIKTSSACKFFENLPNLKILPKFILYEITFLKTAKMLTRKLTAVALSLAIMQFASARQLKKYLYLYLGGNICTVFPDFFFMQYPFLFMLMLCFE